jgi:hypothetical protein
MTWDEWERLKNRTTGKEAGELRLDTAADSVGGMDSANLVVHQDDLGAAGHEAYRLHTRLRDQADIAGSGADDHGVGTTMRAAAALKSHGFAMGAALETTLSVWTSQVEAVLQAFAHVSNHLDYSRKLHAHDDEKIGAEIRRRDGSALPVSVLSSYFK